MLSNSKPTEQFCINIPQLVAVSFSFLSNFWKVKTDLQKDTQTLQLKFEVQERNFYIVSIQEIASNTSINFVILISLFTMCSNTSDASKKKKKDQKENKNNGKSGNSEDASKKGNGGSSSSSSRASGVYSVAAWDGYDEASRWITSPNSDTRTGRFSVA